MATQLDLADAQFVGFAYARSGYISIIGMVESMGLTKKEWSQWKRLKLNTLKADEIDEIDEHFKLKKANKK